MIKPDLLLPVDLELYADIDDKFRGYTKCPFDHAQVREAGGHPVELVYKDVQELVHIAGIPFFFKVEDEKDPRLQYRKAYGTFGPWEMAFRHVNESRQVGHTEIDPKNEAWYISGTLREDHSGVPRIHRLAYQTSALKGQRSISYSMRASLGRKLIPYSFFIFTQSLEENSFRMSLGRTFTFRHGMEFIPETFQVNRQPTQDTEIKDDF